MLAVVAAHRRNATIDKCRQCHLRHGEYIACEQWAVAQYNLDKYTAEQERIHRAVAEQFDIAEIARKDAAMRRLDQALKLIRPSVTKTRKSSDDLAARTAHRQDT